MLHSQSPGASRFDQFIERLEKVVGHADRRAPLRAYLTGLLLPGERKSIEPIAARVDPRHVRARHQSLHHFVTSSPWESEAVLAAARDWALDAMERHGPVAAWVVDDTEYPKKGTHSVGVTRQYCGILGKRENCQAAVAVSLANPVMSITAAYRLYLPEEWAKDARRRREAGVPEDVRSQAKWEIAMDAIDRMIADELPRAPVLADSWYGNITEFREGLTARRLSYACAVKGGTSVWSPDTQPLPPKKWRGRGRHTYCLRFSKGHRPISIAKLARTLSPDAWRKVSWREGTKGAMRSRFACVRVRPGHGYAGRHYKRPPEWLLMEWPCDEKAPSRYWLSNAPETASLMDLVGLVTIRWRIERDFQELKDEIGLDHFEGRGWRGFHHHGALCIAAYAFLASERARLSPPQPLAFLRAPALPKGFRPRGSPVAA